MSLSGYLYLPAESVVLSGCVMNSSECTGERIDTIIGAVPKDTLESKLSQKL